MSFPFIMQDSDVTLKAVWKENQAAPDEPTAITADVRTITLDSPQDGVEYILVPHGQTPTDADWTSAKTSGGGTEIVFDSLVPHTEYDVYPRLPGTEEKIVSPASAPAKVTTLKAEQAAPAAPQVTAEPNSVTVDPAMDGAEYIVVPKGQSIPENAVWTTLKDGKAVFTGLDINTDYDVYARMKETDRQNPSPASKTEVKTPKYQPVMTTAPEAADIEYNGGEQALLIPGSVEGGTLRYSLDDGATWTENVPTVRNAGDYTVRYKVEGDATHEDVAEQSVSVTIAKSQLNVRADDKAMAYRASDALPELTYTVTGLQGEDKAESVLSGALATTATTDSDAGGYPITIGTLALAGPTPNYELTFEAGTLTVSKADQAPPVLTVTNVAGSYTITATPADDQTSAFKVFYSLDLSTWTETPADGVTDADGDYYFKTEGNGNYNDSPMQMISVGAPVTAATLQPTALTKNSATLNGSVSRPGKVSAVRFEWKKADAVDWTTVNPTVADTFSAEISGLTADTEYVYYAVATLASGGEEVYGSEIRFRASKENPPTGSIEAEVKATEDRLVVVSVEEGNRVIASAECTASVAGGKVTFNELPDGFYNVVVRTKDGKYTETQMIAIQNGSGEKALFNVPVGKLATEVNIVDDATPPIAVEGLGDVITADEKTDAANGTKNIDVVLEVDQMETDELPDDELTALNEVVVSNGQIDTFLDMSLFKTTTTLDNYGSVTGVETDDIGGTNTTVLEIAIPYADAKTKEIMMYRYHSGAASVLKKVDSRISNPGVADDGKFYVDEADGYIFLYASGFSTYAIGTPKPATPPIGSTPIGGGSGTQTYPPIIPEMPHGGVEVSPVEPKENDEVAITPKPDDRYEVDTVTVSDPDGKPIPVTKNPDGTYTFKQPKGQVTIKVTFAKKIASPTVTGVADWLIIDEHIVYISGYSDGTVRPQGNITCAETAMMFYRLLKNKNISVTESFKDVPDDAWYAQAVGVLSSLDIIRGYQDNTFRPQNQITRAEFSAVATRFAIATGGKSSFADVPDGHWAEDNVATASDYGWINGYEDGNYRPSGNITRAEAATIVNHMTGRAADEAYVLANRDHLAQFSDLQDTDAWYYFDMTEASTEHNFDISDGEERWK